MDKIKEYCLVYIQNGIIQETIIRGSASLCAWKKHELQKQPNYKTGLLQIRSYNGLLYGPKILTNK